MAQLAARIILSDMIIQHLLREGSLIVGAAGLCAAFAAESAPAVRVVFPAAGSTVSTATQTYLIGSVTPPDTPLRVNAQTVTPWRTGGCDAVVGDGSPTSRTSGREPYTVQGIELGLGMYEILGDVILKSEWSPPARG